MILYHGRLLCPFFVCTASIVVRTLSFHVLVVVGLTIDWLDFQLNDPFRAFSALCEQTFSNWEGTVFEPLVLNDVDLPYVLFSRNSLQGTSLRFDDARRASTKLRRRRPASTC